MRELLTEKEEITEDEYVGGKEPSSKVKEIILRECGIVSYKNFISSDRFILK